MLPGFIQKSQCLYAAAKVALPHALVMRDDRRNSGFSSDQKRLLETFDHFVSLISNVTGVDAAVRAERARHLDHLTGGRSSSWRIEEPGRKSQRTLLKAIGQEILHLTDFALSRSSTQIISHHLHAKGDVPSEKGGIDGWGSIPHLLDVFGEGRRNATVRFEDQAKQPGSCAASIVRRATDPTLSSNDRGNALRQLGSHLRANNEGGIVVCMHIDEPWAHHQAANVY